MINDFYNFEAGKIVDNDLYFSSVRVNGLFKRNIETGDTIFLGQFPHEPIIKEHLHKICLLWKNCLVFTPEYSSYLHIWNIEQRIFRTIELDRYSNGIVFADGYITDDYLFIFPSLLEQPLLKINLNTGRSEQLSYFNQWCRKNIKIKKKFYFARFITIGKHVFLPVMESNILVKFSPETKCLEEIEVPVQDMFAVFTDGFSIWILTQNGKYIYKTDAEFSQYKQLKCLLCETLKNNRARRLNNVVCINSEVYVLPGHSQYILKLNKRSEIFEKICDYPPDFMFYNKLDIRFSRYDIYNDRVILFPRVSNALLAIDSIDSRLSIWKFNNFNEKVHKKNNLSYYQNFINEVYERDKFKVENELITLENFLSYTLVKENCNEESDKPLSGRGIWKKLAQPDSNNKNLWKD